MASGGGSVIIVWEWLNEFGMWMPYEPHVSKFIEDNKNASGHIALGHVERLMTAYVIDTTNFEQITQSTGTVYPIRRSMYPVTHPAANGIVWQWGGDYPQKWVCYEFNTMEIIEQAHYQGLSQFNLQQTPSQLPYVIDFQNMSQTKLQTGFVRRVRRHTLLHKYPVTSLSSQLSTNQATSSSAVDSSNPLSTSVNVLPPSPPSGAASNGLESQIAANFNRLIKSSASSAVNPPNFNPGPSTSNHKSTKGKASKKKTRRAKQVEEVWMSFVDEVTDPPDDEDCCICYDTLESESGYDDQHGHGVVFKLTKCSHMFHGSCLHAMYESGPKNGHLQCPTCKEIYGEKMGDSPAGTMSHRTISASVPGYAGCPTIVITYNFSPGIQGPEHPHPGQRYYASGFPRVCYLPANDKGKKVLKLLQIAFDRRLTFTISQSATTGQSDTVTWNEIHHKTEFGSNGSGHGYPDPNYLDNVLMELDSQGVTEELLARKEAPMQVE